MLTNGIRSVLKDHFTLLSRQDDSLGVDTFEEGLESFTFFLDFFPLVLVSTGCGIHGHESLGVADVSTETIEFNNLEFSVDRSHVLLLAFPVVSGREFEVDDRALSNTITVDNELLFLGVQVADISGQETHVISLNFDGRVLNNEVIVTSWGNGALLRDDAVWSSVKDSSIGVGDLEVEVQVDEGSVLNRELVVATGVHQSRLEDNVLNVTLVASVVDSAASLQLNLFGSAFRAMLRLFNHFDQLDVGVFTLIDDDFFLNNFTLGWLLWRGGLLTSGKLSCGFTSFLLLNLSLLTVTHDLLMLRRSNHAESLHGVIPILVITFSSLHDFSDLAVDLSVLVLLLDCAFNHDLDAFVRVGFEVTFRRIESEFILVSLIPSELNMGVTVVCKHEAHSLGLTDNAVTNVELIFSFVGKSLKSDLFFVACSNEPDLVLLVDIVQSSEGKLESILLSLLRSVADIESVVGFLGDGVRQAATFEGEAVVSNGIEADCGWHLSLILENDRHDAVLTNTGLAELKSGVSVLLIRLSRLLNLQSRKSAFTTKVEN
jgi:hypothetical protein